MNDTEVKKVVVNGDCLIFGTPQLRQNWKFSELKIDLSAWYCWRAHQDLNLEPTD